MADSRRILLAVMLMTLLAVVSNAHSLRRLVGDTPKLDPASYDRRLTQLKPLLPAFGIVGYLGDNEDVFAGRNARNPYYLTQYALAPLVVDRTPSHRLIVAHFGSEDLATQAILRHGLFRVLDVGGGLSLLRSDRYDDRPGDVRALKRHDR